MSPDSLISKWGCVGEALEPRLLFAAPRTTDYFPIDPGTTWQYRCSDGDEKFVAETCIRDRRSTLDGVKTSVMDTGDGKTYYSFADGALRTHKETWRDDEDDGTSTARYDAPYKLVPSRLRIGTTFENQGAWHGKSAEGMTWTGTVAHTLTVVRREDVTVPAGTFSALRIRLIKSETMDSPTGWTATMKQNNTLWLAKDVGLIKSKIVEDEKFFFNGQLESEEQLESTQRLRKSSLLTAVPTAAVTRPQRLEPTARDADDAETVDNLESLERLLGSPSESR